MDANVAAEPPVDEYYSALRKRIEEGDPCCRLRCSGRIAEHWGVLKPIAEKLYAQQKATVRSGIKFMTPYLSAFPLKKRVHVKWALPEPVGAVCSDEFALFHGLTPSELRQSKNQGLSEDMFAPHVHGLSKRETGNNSLLPETIGYVSKWILRKAEQCAMVEPTRGERRVMAPNGQSFSFLPTYYTQERLYHECIDDFKAEEPELFFNQTSRRRPRYGRKRDPDDAPVEVTKPIGFSTFVNLFTAREDLAHIKIRSPYPDMCDSCPIFRNQFEILGTARPRTDLERATDVLEEPEAVMEEWRFHLDWADAARDKYNAEITDSRMTCPIEDDGTPIEGRKWEDWAMHLTFDFAQQLELPHCIDQPSLSPLLAVNMFGVCNDGLNLQTNFLFKEGDAGKSANAVVTMLDRFLEHLCRKYGAENVKRIKALRLHADNCRGQTKSNTMTKFLVWLASSPGRARYGFETIELKFMPKGHARCSADRNFAVIKNAFKKADAFTIGHIGEIVSGTASNEAIILKSGDMYNYTEELDAFFKSVADISSFSEFRFTSEAPGVVCVRKFPNDSWADVPLWQPADGLIAVTDPSVTMAAVLAQQPESPVIAKWQDKFHSWRRALKSEPGKGLPAVKVYDMHEKLREYVPDEFKDELCPRPANYAELKRKDLLEQHKLSQLRNERSNGKGKGKGKGKKRMLEGERLTGGKGKGRLTSSVMIREPVRP